jgi:HEAT repeat protein
MNRRSIHFPVLLLAALLMPPAGIVHADVIRLKNGGEIRGQMDRAKAAAEEGPLEIVTQLGIRLRVAREDVDFYVFRSARIEEYETRSRRAEMTVEDQWALAQWCARQHLDEQRQAHLYKVIQIDPDHEQARKLLDHVRHRGNWVSREEMMRDHGYVKYKNHYVTLQEMALIEQSAQEEELNKEWVDRIKRWRAELYSSSPVRSRAAWEALQQLEDPAAVPALVHLFQNHDDRSARLLMVEILAAIDSPAAAEGLASQAIFDSEPEIRQAALQAIPKAYYPDAGRWFADQLTHSENAIVNRAGVALQQVGSEEVLGDLINSLVTSHSYTVYVPYRDGIAFNIDKNSGNSRISSVLPPQIEALARAGQLPYGVQVNPAPGYATGDEVKWKPVKMQRTIRNQGVLSALETLTDENFGFDQRLWRLWLASHKNQGVSLSKQRSAG